MIDYFLEDKIIDQLYRIREHLHQYPELSFKEYTTSAYICSWLDKWKIPYKKIAETGIIVDIIGEKDPSSHCIAIRADIDALPIQEETDLVYASVNKGVMHACGHDGHTTILLGTIYLLNQLKKNLQGTVRCIFQPGEEEDGAAKLLIKEGVLDNPKVHAMLALHLWPHLSIGTVGIKYGCVTAGYDDFHIKLSGQSGHAGRPHHGLDAIAIGAQVIQSLQFLTTKMNDPLDPVVINIGQINGGTANNVIAESVVLEGTIRTTSQQSRVKILSMFTNIVESIPKMYGGSAELCFIAENPPVLNNDKVTETLQHAAEEVLGSDNVYVLEKPSMGADDFGSFSEKIPSSYFRLGVRERAEEIYDLHHPKFNFPHEVIPIGVKVFTNAVLHLLDEKEVTKW
ncbi:M20 metallopeptidase family protein [Metabacillus litoralis]|uniref:M20 metallopeptidase family protein n=1 Tax=Metabacillus litoralis TaxID=152268 RepID=UPI00203B2A25|nr:M20 family metallopeptidase [Metabacillus litoralis]MCM3409514.1 M20 family metallopeptidase [Metabacillus litoralis]